jgi:hypothetical protein
MFNILGQKRKNCAVVLHRKPYGKTYAVVAGVARARTHVAKYIIHSIIRTYCDSL